MRYSRCLAAPGIAAICALAAVPLQTAAAAPMTIGICGQPGMEIRLPHTPRQQPPRDDGACGCHAVNPRKRANCCDADDAG